MAKISIPDALKAAVPQTFWGRVLAATPVVMTVVATALAGLASSEMTRAQYARSLAAQQQSKAGDQWSFFQAKRLRGTIQRSTLDLLQAGGDVHPLDAESLRQAGADAATLAALQQTQLPALPPSPSLDPDLQAALQAVESSQPETAIRPFILRLTDKALEAALTAAKDQAREFDDATRPINQTMERLESVMRGRDFMAARLRYLAARYDAEARLNQAIGNLYELQVRRGNLVAERHHKRSLRFFYGMLAAQAAVIMATFSLAAQKRSLLWSLAAAAGAGAISFAVYVYLFI